MLFLVFQAGENRYAIDAAQAVEILPLVYWKPLASGPLGVAGMFNYRGTPVPLIDLTDLIAQSPSRTWMSTRIIVVRRGTESGDEPKLLGLLAEQVTETLQLNEEDFKHAAVARDDASYLGRIAVQPSGMIQRVAVRNLLPADVRIEMLQEEHGRVS